MIDQFNLILNILLLVFIPLLLFFLTIVIFLAIKSKYSRRVMEGINSSIGPLLNAVGNSANALTSSIYGMDPSGYLMSTASSAATGSMNHDSRTQDFIPSDEPVFLLGRKYSSLHQLDELRRDFTSRLWMTYRSGFPPIGGTGPSSDRGWGCMLRCGQMVLAQALVMYHLGRDWTWSKAASRAIGRSEYNPCPLHSDEPVVLSVSPISGQIRNRFKRGSNSSCSSSPGSGSMSSSPKIKQANVITSQPRSSSRTNQTESKNQSDGVEREMNEIYVKILRLFQDKKNQVYSIHQIAQMGDDEGKPVGTWFGPNTIAQSLRKLACYDHWNELVIHVALDNVVVIQDIKSECIKKNVSSFGNNWKPLILFIPLRLGLSDINSVYFKAIASSFKLPSTLGMIGGRPNHALYFVGVVGRELIYLDPHTTQQVVDLDPVSVGDMINPEDINDDSYHCTIANRMDMSELDPSISLCFFFKSESDFDSWVTAVKTIFIHQEKQPMFEIANKRQPEWQCVTNANVHDESDGDFANYEMTPSTSNSKTRVRMSSGHGHLGPIFIGNEAKEDQPLPDQIKGATSGSIDPDDFDDEFEML